MTAVKSLELAVNLPPAPLPILQQGPLRIELRLANDVCSSECPDGKHTLHLRSLEVIHI